MNPTKHFKRSLRRNKAYLVAKKIKLFKRSAGEPVFGSHLSAFLNIGFRMVDSPFSVAFGPSTIPGCRFTEKGD